MNTTVAVYFVFYVSNTDLKELRKYYSDMVISLPDDFLQSIQWLQHLLPDERIGSVLTCTSPLAANQRLLDYLIKNVERKENILEFCEHLELIKNSPKLQKVIENLRKGL